jgi:hypothetical protein
MTPSATRAVLVLALMLAATPALAQPGKTENVTHLEWSFICMSLLDRCYLHSRGRDISRRSLDLYTAAMGNIIRDARRREPAMDPYFAAVDAARPSRHAYNTLWTPGRAACNMAQIELSKEFWYRAGRRDTYDAINRLIPKCDPEQHNAACGDTAFQEIDRQGLLITSEQNKYLGEDWSGK